ncbi:hypothetical protein H5410_001387 [Solanum commersonii]|uniref:Uncharacterized protein n=1 Tax=Solanum commersonii TaxID=4109 RepID=A0A9J6AYT3_SOLCO|nr:hypothetical protein H5410_001387 [Solanum commersonii]
MNLTLLRDTNFYVITKLFRFWKELSISYPSIDYVLDSLEFQCLRFTLLDGALVLNVCVLLDEHYRYSRFTT